MGGGQTSTVSQQSGPPSYLQPFLQTAAGAAMTNYNSSSPQYFPGQTVVNQSPQTQAAIGGTTARAENGSPINTAAGGYLQNVLNGNYLNPGNPYQTQLNQSIQDAVIPSVESQFSQNGRYGSGAFADSMTRQLADSIAPSVYGNYQQERGNQQAAAQMAPAQANQDYVDLGQLNAAGQQQDQYGQSIINANVNKYNYNQNLQTNKLTQLMALLNGGNFGTQGTSTTTQPTDILGGLGGLLGGLL